MIAKNHYVACTVLVKDEEDRYVFLVKKEEEGFSFPATEVLPKKTGLACIIDRMKDGNLLRTAVLAWGGPRGPGRRFLCARRIQRSFRSRQSLS